MSGDRHDMSLWENGSMEPVDMFGEKKTGTFTLQLYMGPLIVANWEQNNSYITIHQTFRSSPPGVRSVYYRSDSIDKRDVRGVGHGYYLNFFSCQTF